MNVLLATSNPHKLEEITAVIDTPALRWRTLDWLAREYGDRFTEPVEDRDTFEGNALKKAAHYAGQSGWVAVADDSGLAVDALGGAPGVISARYSGVSGPRSEVDPANNAKLLRELEGVPVAERTARFVCVMAMVWPSRKGDVGEHEPLVVRGEVVGRILLPEEADDVERPERGRGDQGFGYDPLFVLPDEHPEFPGTTTAELTAAQKNALSHRGVASRALLAALVERGVVTG